jgi:hypothetical protein
VKLYKVFTNNTSPERVKRRSANNRGAKIRVGLNCHNKQRLSGNRKHWINALIELEVSPAGLALAGVARGHENRRVQFLNRMATAVLSGVAKSLWGFAPNLMPHIVEQKGPVSALSWFVRNMPRYEQTRTALGPIRTHILCTAISVLNGCRYCTYGHAYALELCYLIEHGTLFPLDEEQIVGLSKLSEQDMVAQFQQALLVAGLPHEVEVLHRLLQLRSRTVAPLDAHDRRLQHLIDMLAVLNSCGIRGKIPPDQAHDPINRNLSIKQRYAEARCRATPSFAAT